LTGIIGKKMHIHHIVAVWLRPDLKYVESNVILILKDIHKLFHKLYGIKYFNKNDWIQFVKNKEYLNIIKKN
jgi:hypothetical protein